MTLQGLTEELTNAHVQFTTETVRNRVFRLTAPLVIEADFDGNGRLLRAVGLGNVEPDDEERRLYVVSRSDVMTLRN